MPDLISLVCSFSPAPHKKKTRKRTRKMMRIQKMDLHFLQSQAGLHLLPLQVDLHLLQYNQLINQQQAHLLRNPRWNALLIEMNSRLQLIHILQIGAQIPKNKCGDIGDKYGLPIGSWCVSAVTDYEQLFYDAATFNSDLSGWDTSAVTKMDATFAASGFNGDLNTWDTGRVTRKVRVSIVLCVNVWKSHWGLGLLLSPLSISLFLRIPGRYPSLLLHLCCPNISYISLFHLHTLWYAHLPVWTPYLLEALLMVTLARGTL